MQHPWINLSHHRIDQGALPVLSPHPPGWAPEFDHLKSWGETTPCPKTPLEEGEKKIGIKQQNIKKQSWSCFLWCGENQQILLADPSSWLAKYHNVPCWLRALVARERVCTYANPYSHKSESTICIWMQQPSPSNTFYIIYYR